jgi:hypothetical protein
VTLLTDRISQRFTAGGLSRDQLFSGG